MSTKKVDFIIVGQGIAGTTLAHLLEKKGKTFHVFDFYENKSSHIAAGLINPIVFKRLNKSWKADDFMPFLNDFYTEIEEKLDVTILYKKEIARLFSSFEDQNNWDVKSTKEGYSKYLTDKQIPNLDKNVVEQKFGHGVVSGSGHLDIKVWLEAHKNHFISKQSYTFKEVNKADIELTENGVILHGVEATRLIFAQGFRGIFNDYFNYLPLKTTKGELVKIKVPALDTENVINKNMFVLPKGNNEYLAGSTYGWNDYSTNTTEEAKTDLFERISAFIKTDFTLVEQTAGVRPTVLDRRPLIGIHPEHKQLSIFNGLGTKGVMIAPFYGNQFINHLTENTPLDEEVDIKRFEDLNKS